MRQIVTISLFIISVYVGLANINNDIILYSNVNKKCQGCQKNLWAGKFIYCDGYYAGSTKTDCNWSGGPGECEFTPIRGVTVAECAELCEADSRCNYYSYENGFSCILYFMTHCTIQDNCCSIMGTIYQKVAGGLPTTRPTTRPTARPTPRPTARPTPQPSTPQPTTQPSYSHGCYNIDNGGWQLVRHAYNKWHPSTDQLKGTAMYGTFTNDPESMSDFSVKFKPNDATEFMFSNGDCSQYLITKYSQLNGPRLSNPYPAVITRSHLRGVPHYENWYFRSGNLEDPWISFDNHVANNCLNCLYGENDWHNSNLDRFPSDPYVNVFIRSGTSTPDIITFGFEACEKNYGGSGSTFTITFWWGERMFECSVVPRRKRTLYTCNSQAQTTKKCIPSTTTSLYAMQISNPTNDDACIDGIRFKEGNEPFSRVNVRDEWVGDNGYFYRYYNLVNPSNLPSNAAGAKRSSIPVCQTELSNAGVYCPVSNHDSMDWKQKEVGFNIFSSSPNRADDCVLRFSQRHSGYNNIGTEWIDPNKDLVIFSHGWQPSVFADNSHQTSDQWKDIVPEMGLPSSVSRILFPTLPIDFVFGKCISGSNSGGNEPCPPTDHDAQYWIEQDWNVVMIDWRQWANTYFVNNAEMTLYTSVLNGKTVIDMLYELLIQLLDLTNWNGNELRLVGHSLGSQVVLNLGSRIEIDTSHSYHVSRIALLDHYFSTWGKDYLGKHDPHCNEWCSAIGIKFRCWYCTKIWVGEYARWTLLRNIKLSSKGQVIVENYRSSAISSNVDSYLFGDENAKLDKKTIFSELTPKMYGIKDLIGKHNYAFAEYMHCMKWVDEGPLDEDAPSCRMSTTQLLNGCNIHGQRWDTECNVHYQQIGGETTTWDSDNLFKTVDGSRHLLETATHIDRVYLPSEGIYTINSIYTGKSFDCSGSNSIIQKTSLGNNDQKFNLVALGNDYYTIKCFKNNKCMDLSGSRNVLQQWNCHNGVNQQFKFIQQHGSHAIIVGNDKTVKATSVNLVGSVDSTYDYDQLFSITAIAPSGSYQPIPKHITVDGQCRSGGPGEPTTQSHFVNGITISDVSYAVCKTRLFEKHIENSAYIWAEYKGDGGKCWIGQNTGYTGNGIKPYVCTLVQIS